MSILLFVIGAITLVLGALAIGFGIPINEFSFGNTLIMAGTTAAAGGLIVIGLGAVVSHLQRVAEVLAMRASHRPARAADVFEAGRVPTASRVPFPPKPKAEPATDETPSVEPPFATLAPAFAAAETMAPAEAPSLPNPDVPPTEIAEAVPPPSAAAMPLPGAEPSGPAAPAGKSPLSANGSAAGEHEPEPLPPWLTASRTPEPRAPEEAEFEAVWPAAETRTVDQPTAEERQSTTAAPPASEAAPETATSAAEHRTVAILKSGVVDGMGYTLYVDGSIEAELPQGTLRFASISDLREHLEKTS